MTAAVALLHGWSNPLDLLALAPEDYEIAVAIVTEANRQAAEVQHRLADYTASRTAGLTVRGVSQVARGVVKALARR